MRCGEASAAGLARIARIRVISHPSGAHRRSSSDGTAGSLPVLVPGSLTGTFDSRSLALEVAMAHSIIYIYIYIVLVGLTTPKCRHSNYARVESIYITIIEPRMVAQSGRLFSTCLAIMLFSDAKKYCYYSRDTLAIVLNTTRSLYCNSTEASMIHLTRSRDHQQPSDSLPNCLPSVAGVSRHVS